LFAQLKPDVLAKALEAAMGAACINGALAGAARRRTRL